MRSSQWAGACAAPGPTPAAGGSAASAPAVAEKKVRASSRPLVRAALGLILYFLGARSLDLAGHESRQEVTACDGGGKHAVGDDVVGELGARHGHRLGAR